MFIDSTTSRSLALIFRNHAVLARNLTAARTLLQYCQENKAYPLDFERELEDIKKNPAYQQIAETLDRVAALLEQGAERIDLSEVMKLFPPGTPTN